MGPGGKGLMGTPERETRERFERWVDERIHAAISNLTSPFEKRVHSLRGRVERLRDRFQDLSRRLESFHTKSTDTRHTDPSGGRAGR